jgi:hypothetical protein
MIVKDSLPAGSIQCLFKASNAPTVEATQTRTVELVSIVDLLLPRLAALHASAASLRAHRSVPFVVIRAEGKKRLTMRLIARSV